MKEIDAEIDPGGRRVRAVRGSARLVAFAQTQRAPVDLAQRGHAELFG